MRISLRELLIVVAVAAVGLASIRFAGTEVRPLMQLVAGLLLVASLIRAIFDRGQRQAVAAGFFICATLYGLAAHYSDVAMYGTSRPTAPDPELRSTFPPSRALLQLHASVIGFEWVDVSTGEPLDFDPTNPIDEANPDGTLSREEIVLQEIEQGPGRGGGNFAGNARGRSRSPRDSGMRSIGRVMHEQLTKNEFLEASARDRAILTAMRNNVPYEYRPRTPEIHVLVAGHSFFMLAVGYLGGHFASNLYERRRNPKGKGESMP
jgi:hypothetical protein